LAAASDVAIEVLMPCFQQQCLVLSSNRHNPIHLGRLEAMILRLSNGRQPELDELVVPPHVNVRRFLTIAGKEEEPIRPAL
jgi:hypothetical protein